MASVIKTFSEKRLNDLQAGELFIHSPEGEPAICLFLERGDGDESIFGVIKGDGFKSFEVAVSFGADVVVSYGSDWCIHIETTELTRYEISPSRNRQAGNVVMNGDTCSMEFVEYRNEVHRTWLPFDLEKKVMSRSSRGSTGFAWSIWANEEDRLNPKMKPIFSFTPSLDQTALAS